MNDAGVAPPGVMPIQMPTSELRSEVIQYCGNCFQVCHTTFGSILALLPENSRPSSIDSRISPMPNRPITAIRKSKPRINSCMPKVRRNWPVTVSMPTAASAKPSAIEARILNGEPLPMPTKLQKVSRYTAKNSGDPNFNANFATSGARKVIITTATNAPTKDEVNAVVSAAPAFPFWAIG
jgi:hypothetical protein